jgi:hypothetical protein
MMHYGLLTSRYQLLKLLCGVWLKGVISQILTLAKCFSISCFILTFDRFVGLISHSLSQKKTEDEEWEAGRKNILERWCRDMMGLADSPYRSVQAFVRAKEWIMGDGKEWVVPGTGRSKPGKGGKPIPMKDIQTENPFWWVDVVLNLPGAPDYDP